MSVLTSSVLRLLPAGDADGHRPRPLDVRRSAPSARHDRSAVPTGTRTHGMPYLTDNISDRHINRLLNTDTQQLRNSIQQTAQGGVQQTRHSS